MVIGLSLFVAIVGVVLFYIATRAETKRVGEICFFCGLLAFLMLSPGPLLKLLGGG